MCEEKVIGNKKMVDKLSDIFSSDGEDSIILRRAIAPENILKKSNDKDAIITLGVTQAGKSSTLNFLFGCKPFIEMGYVYKDSFILLKQNSINDQYLDENDSEKIFNYLEGKELIKKISDKKDAKLIVNFYIGEKFNPNSKESEEMKELKDFIRMLKYEISVENKENNTIIDYLISKIVFVLTTKIRQMDSFQNDNPSIGFKDPSFVYGAGVSTTLRASKKELIYSLGQDCEFCITTMDLPGYNDVRGLAYKMVTSYSTYKALSGISSIKGVIIVINFSHLGDSASSEKTLSEVFKSSIDMLGPSFNKDNILMLVTKLQLVNKITKKPRSNKELNETVAKELNKYLDLVRNNNESRDVRDIINSIIANKNYCAVAPLKKFDESYEDAVVEENINIENRELILKLIQKLDTKQVNSSDYFKNVFSKKNIYIKDIIYELEEELIKVANMCYKRKNNISNNLFIVRDSVVFLNIMKRNLEVFIKEIELNLIYEKNEFKKEFDSFKKMKEEDVNLKLKNLQILNKGLLDAETVKNHILISAKQALFGKHDNYSFLDKVKEEIQTIEKNISDINGQIKKLNINIEANEKEMKEYEDKFKKIKENDYEIEKYSIDVSKYYRADAERTVSIGFDPMIYNKKEIIVTTEWFGYESGYLDNFKAGTKIKLYSDRIEWDIRAGWKFHFWDYKYGLNYGIKKPKKSLIVYEMKKRKDIIVQTKTILDRKLAEFNSCQSCLSTMKANLNADKLNAKVIGKTREDYLVHFQELNERINQTKNQKFSNSNSFMTVVDIQRIMLTTIKEETQKALKRTEEELITISVSLQMFNKKEVEEFVVKFNYLEELLELSKCMEIDGNRYIDNFKALSCRDLNTMIQSLRDEEILLKNTEEEIKIFSNYFGIELPKKMNEFYNESSCYEKEIKDEVNKYNMYVQDRLNNQVRLNNQDRLNILCVIF